MQRPYSNFAERFIKVLPEHRVTKLFILHKHQNTNLKSCARHEQGHMEMKEENVDKHASKTTDKIMIIGVGSSGYNIASTIRQEATPDVFKNAKYVIADTDKSLYGFIVEEEKEEDYTFIDLMDIDLDNDIPSDFFQDIEKLYIVAGMGGHTASKWVPLISQYAKRKGIESVIAIVSEPFVFEGTKKMDKARNAIAIIADSEIDRLITIKCEDLLDRHAGDIDFFNAFLFADKAFLTVMEEIYVGTSISTEITSAADVDIKSKKKHAMDQVTPKGLGKLDMVIAFDTTGSMAAYIEDVRNQVSEMIPRLFKDNEDLRLGIVAFGDYCDMEDRNTFGDAYQCIPLTNNENDIIKFVKESKDTSGGDGDEFYELVLKKIIDESPWREDSSKAILLIADADPHEIGYTFSDYVVGNQIDWRTEAKKAAELKIKIDTVSIHGSLWYKELSAMTNGISVPFKSSGKTGAMIETATTARSAMAYAECARRSDDDSVHDFCRKRVSVLRGKLSQMFSSCEDRELNDIRESYSKEIDETDK